MSRAPRRDDYSSETFGIVNSPAQAFKIFLDTPVSALPRFQYIRSGTQGANEWDVRTNNELREECFPCLPPHRAQSLALPLDGGWRMDVVWRLTPWPHDLKNLFERESGQRRCASPDSGRAELARTSNRRDIATVTSGFALWLLPNTAHRGVSPVTDRAPSLGSNF